VLPAPTVSCHGSQETLYSLYSWGIDNVSAVVSVVILFQTYPRVENGKIVVAKSDTENRPYLLGTYVLTKVLKVTDSVVN